MKKIILGVVFVFFTIIITNANNNPTKEIVVSVSCYERAESHVRLEQYYYLTYEDQYNYFTEEYDKCVSGGGGNDEIQFP